MLVTYLRLLLSSASSLPYSRASSLVLAVKNLKPNISWCVLLAVLIKAASLNLISSLVILPGISNRCLHVNHTGLSYLFISCNPVLTTYLL